MDSWVDYLKRDLARKMAGEQPPGAGGQAKMRANLKNLSPFALRHWRKGALGGQELHGDGRRRLFLSLERGKGPFAPGAETNLRESGKERGKRGSGPTGRWNGAWPYLEA